MVDDEKAAAVLVEIGLNPSPCGSPPPIPRWLSGNPMNPGRAITGLAGQLQRLPTVGRSPNSPS